MKKEFSTAWLGSSQPRKQRKYVANAPIHLKRKLLSVNLSKDLRKKQEIRNIEVRKNDKVKVMRGKFKNKEGKVIEVLTKQTKIYIEGIQAKKQDGSKVNIAFRPSNLQIIELYSEDKKRFNRKKSQKTGVPSKPGSEGKTSKKEEKSVVTENKK